MTMPAWRRSVGPVAALVGILALGTLVLSPASPAVAHVRSTTGYINARSDGSDIRFTLWLEYELLARAVGLGPDAVDAGHDQARARVLDARSGPRGDLRREPRDHLPRRGSL